MTTEEKKERNLATRVRRQLKIAYPFFRLHKASATEQRNGYGPWQLVANNTIRDVGTLEFLAGSWQQTLRPTRGQ